MDTCQEGPEIKAPSHPSPGRPSSRAFVSILGDLALVATLVATMGATLGLIWAVYRAATPAQPVEVAVAPPPSPEPEPPPSPPAPVVAPAPAAPKPVPLPVAAWRREQLEFLRAEQLRLAGEAEAAAAAAEAEKQALLAERERRARQRSLVEAELRALGSQVEQLEVEAEVERLERDVLVREFERVRTDFEHSKARPGYAILPFRGPNGTWRRPIAVECAGDQAWLPPDGPRFQVEELTALQARSNRFVTNILRRASLVETAGSPTGERVVPYILFIVRPDGIKPFYEARSLIEPLGIPYGYELIDQDWPIEYPALDDPTVWDPPADESGAQPPLPGNARPLPTVDAIEELIARGGPLGNASPRARTAGRPGLPGGWPGGLFGSGGLDPLGSGEGLGNLRPGTGAIAQGTPGNAVASRAPGASGGLGRSPIGTDELPGFAFDEPNPGLQRWPGSRAQLPSGVPSESGETTGEEYAQAPGGLEGQEPGVADQRPPESSTPGSLTLPQAPSRLLPRTGSAGSTGAGGNAITEGQPGPIGSATENSGLESDRPGGSEGTGQPQAPRSGVFPIRARTASSRNAGPGGPGSGLPLPEFLPVPNGLNGGSSNGSSEASEGQGSPSSGSSSTGGSEAGEGSGSPSNSLRRPLEIVVACSSRGAVVHPGSYRFTTEMLRNDPDRLARTLQVILVARQAEAPHAALEPQLRVICEPGGSATYWSVRRQLLDSGLDWPLTLQLAERPPWNLFGTERW